MPIGAPPRAAGAPLGRRNTSYAIIRLPSVNSRTSRAASSGADVGGSRGSQPSLIGSLLERADARPTSSTVVEARHSQGQWRRVLKRQRDSRNMTLDWPLPPARCHPIFTSTPPRRAAFASVWFKGMGRRSAAGAQRRHLRNVLRFSNMHYYTNMEKAKAAEARGDARKAKAFVRLVLNGEC